MRHGGNFYRREEVATKAAALVVVPREAKLLFLDDVVEDVQVRVVEERRMEGADGRATLERGLGLDGLCGLRRHARQYCSLLIIPTAIFFLDMNW